MNEDVFPAREGCLISLTASVAAGCVPCAGYYVDRARAAGVSDGEVREAIAAAESVRRLATDDCVRRARRRLGDEADQQVALHEPESEEDLLRWLAAAYAVNSHALVARLLDAALARQLPGEKLGEAVHIARGVRGMALAIVERLLAREGAAAVEPDAPPSCVCG